MTSFIREYGPEIAADFPVCAITPGDKRPIGKGWQNNPLSPDECRGYGNEDAGVGIILGKGEYPCYGIDVDVAGDFECSRALLEVVARHLMVEANYLIHRVGNAPKFLVPVLGEEAGWKKAVTPWYEKDGVRSRIEFLGEGQQFVALALHPNTQRPYEWKGLPLFGRYIDPPQYLPRVSHESIEEIFADADAVFFAHGWNRCDSAQQTVKPRDPSQLSADELVPQYRLGASLAEAKKWLNDLDGKDDYDTWLRVGMALHHEFSHSQFADEALILWDEWSASGKSYKGYADLAYRWASFGSNTGLSVTCRWLKRVYEEKHYDFAQEMTEEGRVARFVRYYEGNLKFTKDAGKWFRWDGLIWQPLFQCEVDALAREITGPVLRDDIDEALKGCDPKEAAKFWKFYANMQQATKAHTLAKAAEKCTELWANIGDFNANPRWFGVLNGVIDLEELTFKVAEKSMMVSQQANVEYDADAVCPVWKKTVSEIFFGDEAMVDYVQRLFGYMMLGNPTEEVMTIFHGNGCNGKSTLMHVMTDLFGGYSHSASADLLTSLGSSRSSAGGARADIVALQHKRLVVMSELDMKARMQEASLKSLVSHDEISARGLYESGIRTFRPTWVVAMLTNYMPRIDGSDEGIWRRIHAVPFDRDFDKDTTIVKDTHRVEKLQKERPGILNWLIEGVRKYRERGLKQPEKVKAESAEYKQSMDIVGEWIADRCTAGEDAKVPASVAFSSWEAYAKANGVDYAIKSRTDLTKVLKRRGVVCKMARCDGKLQRCYVGLTLAEQTLE